MVNSNSISAPCNARSFKGKKKHSPISHGATVLRRYLLKKWEVLWLAKKPVCGGTQFHALDQPAHMMDDVVLALYQPSPPLKLAWVGLASTRTIAQ